MRSVTSPASPPVSTLERWAGSNHFAHALHSVLSLFWLEFRRSQGYWLLPVMVGLGIFAASYRNYDGVVLWRELSFASLRSYAVIAPLTAALAAWLADRKRRRRTTGLIESVPTAPVRRDLLNVGVATLWGLIGYGLVAAWFAWNGITGATWGGPDLGLILTGALAIPIFAGIGGLIGRLVPSKFSPILALGATFLLTIGADAWKQTTTHYQLDGTPAGYSQEQPLQLLMPWGLTTAPWGDFTRPLPYVRESLLWLTGLLAVTIAVTALIRSRSAIAWAGLAISIVIAGIGAVPLIDRDRAQNPAGQSPVSFTWSCQTQSGIEVCVHPAYESRLVESGSLIGDVVSPIAGLEGVPTVWRQAGPWGPPTAGAASLDGFDWRTQLWAVADEVFPIVNGHGGPESSRPASQLVILEWLAARTGLGHINPGFFGWPSEVPTSPERIEGNIYFPPKPDEAAVASFELQLDAAVAHFASLPEAEQRAWLEANWDELRAGTLTLEDLP